MGDLPADLQTGTARAALYEIAERLREATLKDLRRGVLATTSLSAPPTR